MAQTLAYPDVKEQLKDNAALCIYGIGDGSLYAQLKAWLKKDPERYLIFVEEEERLFLQAKQWPLAQDPQVRLFFYARENQEIFSQIAWEFLFLKMAYVSADADSSTPFFAQLEHVQNAAALFASDWRDKGEKVLSNHLRNLFFFSNALLGDSLKDSCKGIPAILCGAGPSLNAAMPLLGSLKDKALLIAGGTALSALGAHGIEPHLAAYLDPDPSRAAFSNQSIFETPFFYQSRFSCDLLSHVHGARIWMMGSGNFPLEEWLIQACEVNAERCDSGWTVANFCTAIALHLGCDPLILTGMDFACFEESVYAAGLSGDEHRDRFFIAGQKEGRELYSQRDWAMSALWISSLACTHPERTWFTLSDGLDMQGLEKTTLGAIASQHLAKSYDMSAHLHSALEHSAHLAIPKEKISGTLFTLKESFKNVLQQANALLALWEKQFPKSPKEMHEYALHEIELQNESAFRYFLEPLWNMWKHPILRKEQHPFGRELHRILFFKNTVETSMRVFS
ncbi:MAG TPA: 6-hydroxymethylpterin diphosphokinase MptE-like protein [Rhabdochlamydiaceae bacterium]|jgi:hypothetical protein